MKSNFSLIVVAAAGIFLASGAAPMAVAAGNPPSHGGAPAPGGPPPGGRWGGPGGPGMGRGQGMGRGRRLERMAQELGLSEAQKAKLKPIFDKSRDRSRAVFSDGKLTMDQKMKRMDAIRNETNKQVRPILTAAQAKKWDTLRQQRRGAFGGPGGAFGRPGGGFGGPGGPGGGSGRMMQRMTQDLGLTAAQQTKIKTILDQSREQTGAVVRSKLAPDAQRTRIRQIRENTMKQVKAILTTAQRTKFDQRQAERRRRGPSGPGRPGGSGRPGGARQREAPVTHA